MGYKAIKFFGITALLLLPLWVWAQQQPQSEEEEIKQLREAVDKTVESYETQTHPKFEVYLDKAGEFRFRLKARNGQAILASEGYKAKSSCLNGIESVRKNAVDAEVVDEA